MSHCPNCNNHFGCSCNGGSAPKTASDGKQVCTKCIDRYEALLKNKAVKPKTNINEA